jgi:hypothetical protein
MQNPPASKIELFPPDMFKMMLDHEVNKSRRYGDSLTLVDLLIEADPATPETQHDAEMFTIGVLNIQLRNTDIPCKRGNEFIILMPSTSVPGARTACERIKKQMAQNKNDPAFTLSTFIGMAALPIDHAVSSDELSRNASQALHYVRINHRTDVVEFSETQKL